MPNEPAPTGLAAALAGRTIESANDLSIAEAQRVILRLQDAQ